MNISYQVKSIVPRVRDHRGYSNMIFDISVFIDFVDSETNSTVGYQLYHKFDTEIKYTKKNPFISFEEFTEEQVNSLIETLIGEEKVGGQITLQEWAENRFADIYTQPVPKLFTFQIPTITESVGIGSSPVL